MFDKAEFRGRLGAPRHEAEGDNLAPSWVIRRPSCSSGRSSSLPAPPHIHSMLLRVLRSTRCSPTLLGQLMDLTVGAAAGIWEGRRRNLGGAPSGSGRGREASGRSTFLSPGLSCSAAASPSLEGDKALPLPLAYGHWSCCSQLRHLTTFLPRSTVAGLS